MSLKDLTFVSQIKIRLEVLEEELEFVKSILENNPTDFEKEFYANVVMHLETMVQFNKERLERWTKED